MKDQPITNDLLKKLNGLRAWVSTAEAEPTVSGAYPAIMRGCWDVERYVIVIARYSVARRKWILQQENERIEGLSSTITHFYPVLLPDAPSLPDVPVTENLVV